MGEVAVSPTAASTDFFPDKGDFSFGQMKRSVCEVYGMEDDPRKLDLAGTMIKSIIEFQDLDVIVA